MFGDNLHFPVVLEKGFLTMVFHVPQFISVT